jgi:hypothetical protein
MLLGWQTGDRGLEGCLIGRGPAGGECPVSEMGIASRLPLFRSRAYGFFLECEIDYQMNLKHLKSLISQSMAFKASI